jgi:hypothetical protein
MLRSLAGGNGRRGALIADSPNNRQLPAVAAGFPQSE